MKLPRLKTVLLWLGIVLVIAVATLYFFTPFHDVVRIYLAGGKYYDWIEQNRPYLKQLALRATVKRKVELYSDGQREYPYIFYEAVYGDTDGLIECSYILDIARDYAPKGIKQEHISVILLPAAEQVTINGRLRNIYWGRYIRPPDVPALVERVISGDRLVDLKESIQSHPDYPDLCWADTDPWVKLTSNKRVEPSGAANGAPPRR